MKELKNCMVEKHGVIEDITKEKAKQIIKANSMSYIFTSSYGLDVYAKRFPYGAPDYSMTVSIPGVRL